MSGVTDYKDVETPVDNLTLRNLVVTDLKEVILSSLKGFVLMVILITLLNGTVFESTFSNEGSLAVNSLVITVFFFPLFIGVLIMNKEVIDYIAAGGSYVRAVLVCSTYMIVGMVFLELGSAGGWVEVVSHFVSLSLITLGFMSLFLMVFKDLWVRLIDFIIIKGNLLD